MKVYVVTEGCYSDYHIVAVFESAEAAEELRRRINSYSALVEEYDTEQVTVDMLAGNKMYWVNSDFVAEEEFGYGWCLDDALEKKVYFDFLGEFRCGYTMAKDKEHAIKIIQDRIAEEKAKKAGIV